ncbi:MAG: hypothetical protein Fur0041_12560 [Bacteroidia bacterium]
MTTNARDAALVQLRDSVLFNPEIAGEDELFQGKVLRPILKFQNSIILMLVKQHLALHKVDMRQLPDTEKKNKLSEMIKNDHQLRNILSGIVIGLMTEEELALFESRKATLSKRLRALLEERVISQMQLLSE